MGGSGSTVQYHLTRRKAAESTPHFSQSIIKTRLSASAVHLRFFLSLSGAHRMLTLLWYPSKRLFQQWCPREWLFQLWCPSYGSYSSGVHHVVVPVTVSIDVASWNIMTIRWLFQKGCPSMWLFHLWCLSRGCSKRDAHRLAVPAVVLIMWVFQKKCT